MTTNLQNITLESMCGTLVAKNENGHLTLGMLHLDREPVLSDAQDFDNVLVFVDGEVRIPGGNSNVITVELDEDNDYIQTLDLQAENSWKTVGVNSSLIQVSLNQTTDIEVRGTTTTPGTYSNVFAILDEADEMVAVVLVRLTVSVPLKIEYRDKITTSLIDSATHGGTLEIFLTEPGYASQNLVIVRDQQWNMTNVDTSKITLSPTSGAGGSSMSMPQYGTLLTSFAKATSFTPSGLESTEFWVVSRNQSVKVIVHFAPQITGVFVVPVGNEKGVTKTSTEDHVYINI